MGVANEKPGGSAEPLEPPEPLELLEGEPPEDDEPLPEGDSPKPRKSHGQKLGK